MHTNKDTFFSRFTLLCHKKVFEIDRPWVMGIVNVTPDSFFDGGQYLDADKYVAHAQQLLEQGADVIDVGAVSTRPGAIMLSPEQEATRLSEVIQHLREALPTDTIISADTAYSLPAEAAVKAGADIINDVSGGQWDDAMLQTIAQLHVPYILTHSRGIPSTMQRLTEYNDLVREMEYFFSERLEALYKMGASDVILDPGFGFAKTVEQNYLLLEHLDEICNAFNEPVLAALSRKSMIYKTLDITPQQALNGTTALHIIALTKGARMLRVHDVKEARQVVKLWQMLMENR